MIRYLSISGYEITILVFPRYTAFKLHTLGRHCHLVVLSDLNNFFPPISV